MEGVEGAEVGLQCTLPGVAEIERTAERLEGVPGVILHRLHGSIDPAAQRATGPRLSARELLLGQRVAPTALALLAVVALLVGAVGGAVGYGLERYVALAAPAPPIVDNLLPVDALVTVGIGGNDAGLVGAAALAREVIA